MTNPVAHGTASTSSYTPPLDDPTTQLVAAFIQKNWESHYRAAWMKLGSPTGLKPGSNWNWAAAFFPVPWLAYRRQWGAAAVVFVLSLALSFVPLVNLLSWFGFFIWMGLYGDRIVLRKAWQAADSTLRQFGPGESATRQAAAAGGTSSVILGIALVFVAIVVLGIIAAIAIPKFASTRGRAYEAAMKSDLRSLATAEEIYFTDSSRYTTDLAALKFVPTTGVIPPTITLKPDGSGWSATVKHSEWSSTCAIASGMPNPFGAARDGDPICQ